MFRLTSADAKLGCFYLRARNLLAYLHFAWSADVKHFMQPSVLGPYCIDALRRLAAHVLSK